MPSQTPLDPLPPPSGSNVDSAEFYKTIRLDQVFQLLVDLIQVLQKVAIAQAQNLSVLTQWQQAYTALMNKVPTFTSQSSIFGGTTTIEGNRRDDINNVTSSYTSQLRSLRDQIADDSKAMQSNVNQTNDAVTQQANLATSMLQELTTILNTLYK